MRHPWLLPVGVTAVAFLALWIAWKTGKFLARLALALAIVTVVALFLWYLLHR